MTRQTGDKKHVLKTIWRPFQEGGLKNKMYSFDMYIKLKDLSSNIAQKSHVIQYEYNRCRCSLRNVWVICFHKACWRNINK